MKSKIKKQKLLINFIILAVFWTVLIVILAQLNYKHIYDSSLKIVKSTAIDGYNKDLVYRRWATEHGGVYVPITDSTPPNPYLKHIPERDISTPSGKKLTLVNPAYMTRQVHELGAQQYGLKGHITSLNPLRPSNAADEWEKQSLLAFEKGIKEVGSIEILDGKEYYRYMRPMITEKGCMKCHSHQGYHVGDIRGGISLTVPWTHISNELSSNLLFIFLTYGVIWIIGLVGFAFIMKRIRNDQKRQEKLENILRVSEHKYKSLFDNMGQGMALHEIILDSSGKTINYKFLEANKSFEKLTGLKKENIIGKTVLEVLPETEPYWIEKYGDVVVTGEPLHYENFASELNKYYEVVAYKSQANQFAVIISDVSERRKHEEEIKLKNKELQKLNAEKDKLFSIIAHDLVNPFNSILAFSNLMHSDSMENNCDDMQKNTALLKNTAQQSLNLLTNLLKWAQIQSGKIDYNPRDFALSRIFKDVEELHSLTAKNKNISIRFDANNINVNADYNMINTILRNLVSNAIKFSHSGNEIIVTANKNNNEIKISVKDNGTGINKDALKNIFNINENIINLGTADEKGTGLGLVLCKEFVEKHKGKIWAESVEGIGTTFYFTIPCGEDKREQTESDLDPDNHRDYQDENKKMKIKILIADDEEYVIKHLSIILKNLGKEILYAKNGLEAVEIFQKNPDIDLILMDIGMPKMDGHEATKQIRKLNKDVAIIAQTAHALEGDREKALEAGCNDYISKPIDKDELLEKIGRLVKS